MHASSAVCRHLGGLSGLTSPKVHFPFFFDIHSAIHSFIVRRACCQTSGVTAWQWRYLTSFQIFGWPVLHCQTFRKVQKEAGGKQEQTAEHTHCHPCLGQWLVSRKNSPLWFSASMVFEMVLAPCCLWENPWKCVNREGGDVFLFLLGENPPCVWVVMYVEMFSLPALSVSASVPTFPIAPLDHSAGLNC